MPANPLTTVASKTFPAAADRSSMTTNATGWLNVAYVELATSAAADLTVDNFVVDGTGGTNEFDIAVGAAASEVVVGTFKWVWSVNSQPNVIDIVSPWQGIAAGQRVAWRARSTTSSATHSLAIVYREDNDATVSVAASPKCVPSAANGVSVAGNASAWANSAYVELTSGLANVIAAYSLTHNAAHTTTNVEFELATGAAGSETPITVMPTTVYLAGSGTPIVVILGALLKIDASIRIAVRFRKTGTSTVAMDRMSLNYFDDPVLTEPVQMSLCGASTVYVWMELQTDSGVKYYAKENLALDDTFKEGRVLSFGSIRRAFSRDRGGYETATASIELNDTDRALRGLAATGVLLNKRCDLYAASDAGLRAGLTARRIMQAVVRRYKPLPELKFRFELEDRFGSQFSDFAGDRTIPQRLFGPLDFTNLLNATDHPTSPGNPTLSGKAIPIGYGLLSDEDAGADAVGVVPCHYVGRRTVSAFEWDEYVVFGHAIAEVISWFAAASADAYDLPREKMPTSTEGVDFLIPGFAGWATHVGNTDMYRDFNNNRYFTIYSRGPRSDAAREGKVPITLNVRAIEDVGDGTGELIVSLPEQIEHLICNWIFQSYTSGDWPAIPTTGTPPLDRFDTASTQIVKAASAARLGGSPLSDGYLGAFMLGWEGQFHSIRDVIAEACRSCDIDIGMNKDGQIFMSMIDDSADVVKVWGDVVDVLKGSFDVDRDFDRLANRIEYRYQRQYIKPATELVDVVASGGSPVASVRLPESLREPVSDWLVDNQVQEDATSIAAHDETRLYDLNLPLVRDDDTADDVVGQLLDRLKNGPVHATFDVDLCGTDVENGNNETISHYAGMTVTGWTDRLLRNEEHTTNLDALTVTLVARDLE